MITITYIGRRGDTLKKSTCNAKNVSDAIAVLGSNLIAGDWSIDSISVTKNHTAKEKS